MNLHECFDLGPIALAVRALCGIGLAPQGDVSLGSAPAGADPNTEGVMALEFTLCKVRWEKYPRVSENAHAREWLEFQSTRGLAANTLEAYGRDLDAYLAFLASVGVELMQARDATEPRDVGYVL
jgi:Phage integrase, N-terminal SAM-like domain